MAIINFHGLSWTILEYHGLSWNIMEYHGLSWTIMDYHGLSWTIMAIATEKLTTIKIMNVNRPNVYRCNNVRIEILSGLVFYWFFLIFCLFLVDFSVDLLLVFCWSAVSLLLVFCQSSVSLLSVFCLLLIFYCSFQSSTLKTLKSSKFIKFRQMWSFLEMLAHLKSKIWEIFGDKSFKNSYFFILGGKTIEKDKVCYPRSSSEIISWHTEWKWK